MAFPKKEIFLFNSFGFEGFMEFILQDDQNVVNKILHGIEKFNKKDNKIKNMNRLSETTIDLLHLMNEYGKNHKLKMNLLSIYLTISYK